MSSDPAFSGYRGWLVGLKEKLRRVQVKAAVAINQEILLSRDLFEEFPEMKGFSVSNLKYMRQWFLFYSDGSLIGQQVVGQIVQSPVSIITRIPWGQNLAIHQRSRSSFP